MASLSNRHSRGLFDFLLQHRNKHKLNALIDVADMTPLVHVSGIKLCMRGYTSWQSRRWPGNLTTKNDHVRSAGEYDAAVDAERHSCVNGCTAAVTTMPDQAPVPTAGARINKCLVLALAKTLPLSWEKWRLGEYCQACSGNLQPLETASGSARESGRAVRRSRVGSKAPTTTPACMICLYDVDKAAMRISSSRPKPQNPAGADLPPATAA